MLKLLLPLFILLLSSCSLDLLDDSSNTDETIKDETTINQELSEKVNNDDIIPPSIPNLD